MPSLLVTNDFPPKVGGIQSYLYELWRRLPPDETTVLTTPHAGAPDWDSRQRFRIERVSDRVLLPRPAVWRRTNELAREVGADVIFVDPMLPLGLIGERLSSAPHVLIAHGAEITVPGRIPGSNLVSRRVLRHADGVVAAGNYPAAMAASVAGRELVGVEIPPGVDVERFRPLDRSARDRARLRFGLDPQRPMVLGVSRLVPRKGFDTLLAAMARLDDSVVVAIAGAGRDRRRLESLAAKFRIADRTRFLGRVDDVDLPDLYGCADVFAMLCRDRWRGLEAEGFGIVFVEAAACGIPSVVGRSGGSHEAVDDTESGYVVAPRDVAEVADALSRLIGDDTLRAEMGANARRRARERYSYEVLIERLLPVARGELGALGLLTAAPR